jgi:hypothetical protein
VLSPAYGFVLVLDPARLVSGAIGAGSSNPPCPAASPT